MTCYKCGQPVMGDDLQCDDCRDENLNKCDDCGYENCICDDAWNDEDNQCDICDQKPGNHKYNCPNDYSPYGKLIKEGYD